MALTIRQRIIDAVKTRLQSITITNGYTTDIGNNVFDWRTYGIDSSELPCIVISDPEDTAVTDQYTSHKHGLNISIIIYAAGSTAITNIRKYEGDVYQAIGKDINWSNLANYTEYIGSNYEMAHEENLMSSCTLSIQIWYSTAAWSPYETINY